MCACACVGGWVGVSCVLLCVLLCVRACVPEDGSCETELSESTRAHYAGLARDVQRASRQQLSPTGFALAPGAGRLAHTLGSGGCGERVHSDLQEQGGRCQRAGAEAGSSSGPRSRAARTETAALDQRAVLTCSVMGAAANAPSLHDASHQAVRWSGCVPCVSSRRTPAKVRQHPRLARGRTHTRTRSHNTHTHMHACMHARTQTSRPRRRRAQ